MNNRPYNNSYSNIHHIHNKDIHHYIQTKQHVHGQIEQERGGTTTSDLPSLNSVVSTVKEDTETLGETMCVVVVVDHSRLREGMCGYVWRERIVIIH